MGNIILAWRRILRIYSRGKRVWTFCIIPYNKLIKSTMKDKNNRNSNKNKNNGVEKGKKKVIGKSNTLAVQNNNQAKKGIQYGKGNGKGNGNRNGKGNTKGNTKGKRIQQQSESVEMEMMDDDDLIMQEEQFSDEEDLAMENSQHEESGSNDEGDHNNFDSEEEQEEEGEQKEEEDGDEQVNQPVLAEESDLAEVLEDNDKNLEEYQEELGNKGVVYMSRVPPYMTPGYIRKLLKHYEVERIYLLPESQWVRNNRIKNGGSKRICFVKGWIEFSDKKIAKICALSLNSQKMMNKKGNFYSEDLWNLKYLPKFKWHNLTEKLAHEQRLKKERMKLEMDQERKIQEYYSGQVQKSKTISGIIKRKQTKGKVEKKKERRFGQTNALAEEHD